MSGTGFRAADSLYDFDPNRGRNTVAIVDAGDEDLEASRLQVDNALIIFDTSKGTRHLYLPSAKDLATVASTGQQQKDGDGLRFWVRNARGDADVIVHPADDTHVHYSVAERAESEKGEEIVVGPHRSHEYVLQTRWQDPTMRKCPCPCRPNDHYSSTSAKSEQRPKVNCRDGCNACCQQSSPLQVGRVTLYQSNTGRDEQQA